MSKIQQVLDKVNNVFVPTDEVLNEWRASGPKGNLQFPALLGMIAVKMNWDEEQVRVNDPIVRYYVRNNPDWHVTRGAHGGIMPSEDKQKKESDRLAKLLAKEQARTAVEAKTADAPADASV